MIFKILGARVHFINLSVAIILCLFSLSAPLYAQQSKQLSDAELALCKSKIERAHQGFYRLSYTQAYVRDVIMPSVRTERENVAPHFPVRTSGQNADQLFKAWIEAYPTEYESYLVFLGKQHEKWRTASSTANH